MTAASSRKLYDRAVKKINRRDFKGALNIANQIIRDAGENSNSASLTGALYIDIGPAVQEIGVVEKGISLIERFMSSIISNPINIPGIYYNLANGYAALFDFGIKENPYYGLFEKTELDTAKDCYLKALKNKPKENALLSKIYVNLANCLDKKGRDIDALEYYEKVLKLKPEHAMALGNKGMALAYYSRISAEHQITFFREAHSLISQALKLGVLPESVNYFKKKLKSIERLFPNKKLLKNPLKFPAYTIESDSKIEEFLVKFCLKNKLYLNICNFCQKCDAAIGDTIVIKKMTVPVKSNLDDDVFLRLSKYLNQIKQDFVTARFLLILSRYEGLNLNFVDKRVRIIDTLDYSMHNIYIELVKVAFRIFYDILDKIAYFISDYLNLAIPEKEISFRGIWYSDFQNKVIQSKIKGTKNHSLNAIFDIHKDLEKGGQYENLRKTRNALTHRFIKVGMLQESEDEENMTEDTLVKDTLELARVVRNSIVYLIQFLYIKEAKKEKDVEKPIVPLIAREVPDDLKSDRRK